MTKEQDKSAEVTVGEKTPENEWLENPQVYRVKKAHLQSLGIIPSPKLKILDAGCGPGTYGLILAQEGANVTGIDISPDLVQLAQERADEKNLSFSAKVGDLEKLEFENETFDIIFCGWTLHHFPDLESVIVELKRVLKPNGIMAMVEPNESNLAIKTSRFIEDLPVISNWILKAGWDTPNRTLHMHDKYIGILKKQGFGKITLDSSFPGSLPPLEMNEEDGKIRTTIKWLLHVLFAIRAGLFGIASKILPRPLNGTDLLITAVKQ